MTIISVYACHISACVYEYCDVLLEKKYFPDISEKHITLHLGNVVGSECKCAENKIGATVSENCVDLRKCVYKFMWVYHVYPL